MTAGNNQAAMAAVQKLTTKMVLEVIQHEGLVRDAYTDSVGVWTWSIGITSMSGHNVDRYRGNPQTVHRCLEVAIWLLETKYWPAVLEVFEGVELTEAQAAAALSFHWNTGSIKRASWVKHFKKGNTAAARKAFMSWRKPKEIIPRRKAERDLFFGARTLAPSETVTEWTHVSASGKINRKHRKRITVGPIIRQIMDGVPEVKAAVPKEVEAVVLDAAASDRVSKTEVTSILVGGGSAVALGEKVLEVSQKAKGVLDGFMGMGTTGIILALVLAAGAFLWWDRRRKRKLSAKALPKLAVNSPVGAN